MSHRNLCSRCGKPGHNVRTCMRVTSQRTSEHISESPFDNRERSSSPSSPASGITLDKDGVPMLPSETSLSTSSGHSSVSPESPHSVTPFAETPDPLLPSARFNGHWLVVNAFVTVPAGLKVFFSDGTCHVIPREESSDHTRNIPVTAWGSSDTHTGLFVVSRFSTHTAFGARTGHDDSQTETRKRQKESEEVREDKIGLIRKDKSACRQQN